MQYQSGSLSTIPLNDDYEATDAQLQEILTFLNNSEEKILRSPSGNSWRVVTTNPSYKYMDKIAEQPYTLKFDITEVGEVT
jgi:hypothetical protein